MISNFYETPLHIIGENINDNHYYMKREDLLTYSFGGNKARKAMLFFDDFNKSGCDVIVTYGTSSSNHCRVIANICASQNIPCYIVSPKENNIETYNQLMTKLFNANIVTCEINKVKETITLLLEKLSALGHKPYFIPGGGHGDLGTKAYYYVYKEILKYEKQNNIIFDYIFLTSGTGTTQAGLICGSLINRDNKKIIGISNARRNPYGKEIVIESVKSYLKKINKLDLYISDENIYYLDDYVLDGYGKFNKEILRVIKTVLIRDGIPLDTTYTGKGYWGCLNILRIII